MMVNDKCVSPGNSLAGVQNMSLFHEREIPYDSPVRDFWKLVSSLRERREQEYYFYEKRIPPFSFFFFVINSGKFTDNAFINFFMMYNKQLCRFFETPVAD